MPLCTHAFNKILDLFQRDTAITFPASWYFSLHLMNALSLAASISDTDITVEFAVTVGAKVVIEPETANAEEFTVTNVTGSGPFVLDLDGALTKNHADESEVLCDPGANGEDVREPSGGGFARVAKTRNTTNFASASNAADTNANTISFPTITAPLGTVTHWVKYSASSGGTVWEWARLTHKTVVDASANPLTFPAGNLTSSFSGSC